MPLPPLELTNKFSIRFTAKGPEEGTLHVYLPNEVHFAVENVHLGDGFSLWGDGHARLTLKQIQPNPKYEGLSDEDTQKPGRHSEYISIFEWTKGEISQEITLS
jgi:hypothetical protein